MRRLLVPMTLFFLLCLPLSAYPTATLTVHEIAVTPQGIHMQLHERALGEVLSNIRELSGIRFSFPRSMEETPITASIHAPDWPTAIRELLRSFSTAEVWDKQELSRVYIFERGTAASISETPTNVSESDSGRPEDTDAPEPPPPASLPLPPSVPPPPFQPNQ